MLDLTVGTINLTCIIKITTNYLASPLGCNLIILYRLHETQLSKLF